MYAIALDDFKSIMGCCDRLKTFVVDMHYAQMRALHNAFNSKNILICHFHMTRAIRRKVIFSFIDKKDLDKESHNLGNGGKNHANNKPCGVSRMLLYIHGHF